MYLRWSFYWLLPVAIVGAALGTERANAGAVASACSGFSEDGCDQEDFQSGPSVAFASAGGVTATVVGPNLSLYVVPSSTDPTFLRPLGGATAQWSDSLTFFVGKVVGADDLTNNQRIFLTPLQDLSSLFSPVSI